MPKGKSRERFPELYRRRKPRTVVLEAEIPTYMTVGDLRGHEQVIEIGRKYIVCPFCGKANERKTGDDAVSSWCMECARAIDAAWKTWKNNGWVNA